MRPMDCEELYCTVLYIHPMTALSCVDFTVRCRPSSHSRFTEHSVVLYWRNELFLVFGIQNLEALLFYFIFLPFFSPFFFFQKQKSYHALYRNNMAKSEFKLRTVSLGKILSSSG